jgi:hypothetical protein
MKGRLNRMDKKSLKKDANPDSKPSPHSPENAPSWDSRHNHGLSEDEALKAKK